MNLYFFKFFSVNKIIQKLIIIFFDFKFDYHDFCIGGIINKGEISNFIFIFILVAHLINVLYPNFITKSNKRIILFLKKKGYFLF